MNYRTDEAELYFPSVTDHELVIESTRVHIYVGSDSKKTDYPSGKIGDDERLRYAPHTHTYAEIFASEDSCVSFVVDGGALTLKPGEVLVVPPGCRHMISPSELNTGNGAFFGFSITHPSKKQHGSVYKICKPYLSDVRPMLFHNCEDLLPALRSIRYSRAEDEAAIIVMKAIILLDELYRRGVGAASCKEKETVGKGSAEYNRYVVLDDIVSGCYFQPIRPEDVAARLYLSRRQFDRVVMQRYGKSFGSVISEKRLELAVRYLSTTSLSIDEITARIGISSKASFTRLFKEHYGVTPNFYRRTMVNSRDNKIK